jgi:hypothetical protein
LAGAAVAVALSAAFFSSAVALVDVLLLVTVLAFFTAVVLDAALAVLLAGMAAGLDGFLPAAGFVAETADFFVLGIRPRTSRMN